MPKLYQNLAAASAAAAVLHACLWFVTSCLQCLMLKEAAAVASTLPLSLHHCVMTSSKNNLWVLNAASMA